VRPFEFVIAMVLAAGGVRSIVYHARRPFASADVRDQLLYALYLTGRVGMWFAFSGLFLILAFAGATDPVTGLHAPSSGQVYVDDVSRYRAYVIVFAVLGAMQLLAGWFLGHRGDPSSPEDDDGSTRRP
jgi:hypothetical protein